MRYLIVSLLLTILLIPTVTHALSRETTLILEQIKQLRDDMNKRFEQVDKRFEQVDKRFEFIQALLLALLSVIITGGIYRMYQERKVFKDLNDIVIRMNKLETAVKEIASKDAVLSEHFKKIGLL